MLRSAAVARATLPPSEQHHVARHQSAAANCVALPSRTRVVCCGSTLRKRGQRLFPRGIPSQNENSRDQDYAEHSIFQHSPCPDPADLPFGDESQTGRQPQDQREEVGEFLKQPCRQWAAGA